LIKNRIMTYEEAYPVIHQEVEKRRRKWQLKAVTWMDYDDVSQLIKLHIYKKWSYYDPEKPLAPWVARIVCNQLSNLLRNNYTNVISPCNKCVCALADGTCEIYGVRDNSCPLYRNWFYNKKSAYDIKMPLPLCHHSSEIDLHLDEKYNIQYEIEEINRIMKEHLNDREWNIYKLLYIDNMEESEVIKSLPQKYRQIQGYKNKFYQLAKELIHEKH